MYVIRGNAELIYLRRAICIQDATLTLPEIFKCKYAFPQKNKISASFFTLHFAPCQASAYPSGLERIKKSLNRHREREREGKGALHHTGNVFPPGPSQ